MKAIVLIAGVGKRLRTATDDPKCLLKVGGIGLLERYLRWLKNLEVRQTTLAVGYRKDSIINFVRGLNTGMDINFAENPEYTKGSILSLGAAEKALDGDVILMDGDVLFDGRILTRLAQNRGNVIAIDTTHPSTGEEMMVGVDDGRCREMARALSRSYPVQGEAVGFYRFDTAGCLALKTVMTEALVAGRTGIGYEELFTTFFERTPVAPLVIDGLSWTEIDFEEDLRLADRIAAELPAPPPF
jgi:choline kinase